MPYPATSTPFSTSLSEITTCPAGDVLLDASTQRRDYAPPDPYAPVESMPPLGMPWHVSSGAPDGPTPPPARDTGTGTPESTRRCQDCQCILSRYNEEPYCSSCSRRTRQQFGATPYVPTDVWNRSDVQQALITHDFGRLCQLVRIAGDLRQSDMAELTGLSQPFLSMLESGARRLTNIDKIVVLLAGLNTPAELTGPMLRMPK
ncbi:helix-turn-helix transcriptional regulator [Streptomyces iakyrus]|uniref:helix-turn-helix domain-containing protein n=1 Tax=Streptomyces iakyrus TaxID=68219 RepID=UPI00339F2F36